MQARCIHALVCEDGRNGESCKDGRYRYVWDKGNARCLSRCVQALSGKRYSSLSTDECIVHFFGLLLRRVDDSHYWGCSREAVWTLMRCLGRCQRAMHAAPYRAEGIWEGIGLGNWLGGASLYPCFGVHGGSRAGHVVRTRAGKEAGGGLRS